MLDFPEIIWFVQLYWKLNGSEVKIWFSKLFITDLGLSQTFMYQYSRTFRETWSNSETLLTKLLLLRDTILTNYLNAFWIGILDSHIVRSINRICTVCYRLTSSLSWVHHHNRWLNSFCFRNSHFSDLRGKNLGPTRTRSHPVNSSAFCKLLPIYKNFSSW